MMIFLLRLLLLVFVVSQAHAVQSIEQSIDELVEQYIPGAAIGVLVMDADDGKVIYSRHAQQYFTPASSTKLFTAVAAVDILGPDFRYQTTVSVDPNQVKQHVLKGDLLIQFSGDPSLKLKDLAALIKAVKKYGIEKIEGNIVLDHNIFKDPLYPPGGSIEDLGWYYFAPISGIILNDNAVAYKFTTGNTIGERIKISPSHKKYAIPVTNRVTAATKAHAERYCPLVLHVSDDNVAQFSGCYPLKYGEVSERIAIANPVKYAKQVIKQMLKDESIQLQGSIKSGDAKGKRKTIATHKSEPLRELIKPLLLDSNNTYANAFLKSMGVKRYGGGSFAHGITAEKSAIAKRVNLDPKRLKLSDGAGTRYNLATPHQLGQLLLAIYNDKQLREVILPALPKSGKSGTLQWRMRSYDLKQQFKAKTGTMHDTSSLSGYLNAGKNKHLIVVLMANNIVGGSGNAKQLENSLLSVIKQQA